jgi:murein DD-endopeptidase MepM/ murein hydrolase activator NlpD
VEVKIDDENNLHDPRPSDVSRRNTGYNSDNDEGKSDNVSQKEEENDLKEEFEAILRVKKSTSRSNDEMKKKNAETSEISERKIKKASENNSKNSSTKNQQKKKYIKPVSGKVTSKFGDIKDGMQNDGIYIKAPRGTPVKATDSGTVIYAGNKLGEGYGNVVIINHNDGLVTSYAHLNDITVKKDSNVIAGQKIGTVGSTGDVNGPTLYFEMLKNKKPIDPGKYLEK